MYARRVVPWRTLCICTRTSRALKPSGLPSYHQTHVVLQKPELQEYGGKHMAFWHRQGQRRFLKEHNQQRRTEAFPWNAKNRVAPMWWE